MSDKFYIQIGDSKTEGPVYAQVRKQFETLIRDGQIVAGEALPSPGVLAQRLSVDKGEVQRAYYELERASLVKKKTGRDFLGTERTTYLVN
ncbi:MAG: Bacterial regulatory protein gntR family [Acidobacteriota bacterium]|jgi:DNA-binding transcriptional regulator YhcF (GntR family)|nr:Bacterial regulatory protein gntR family [Acidobacteriota bacterium]